MDKTLAERNEMLVLRALSRTLREECERTVALDAISRQCKAGLPPPVIEEILHRLMAQGHVDREVRSDSVVRIAGSDSEIPRIGGEEIRYLITEVGYERYTAAANREAAAKLAELQEHILALSLTEHHRRMWASIHDYLSWKPGRTVQFMNYGLGFKLTPDEIWQYRELLFNLGLLERGVIESHVQLTEFGARCPRLPAGRIRPG
jgi:hypothetical protein